VLDASESLFLGSGDDFAVDYQASRGIMIEGRYAQNLRHWFDGGGT
jgi:hypothetical protein